MEWEDLKKRVAETSYLPEWLKEALENTTPTDGRPAGPVLNMGVTRWCPFVSNTTRAGVATMVGFNRVVQLGKPDSNGAAQVLSINTKISPCVGAACQMWSGQDCGLKSLTPGMVNLIQSEGQKMRELVKGESDESQQAAQERHDQAMAVSQERHEETMGQIDESQADADQRHGEHMAQTDETQDILRDAEEAPQGGEGSPPASGA